MLLTRPLRWRVGEMAFTVKSMSANQNHLMADGCLPVALGDSTIVRMCI